MKNAFKFRIGLIASVITLSILGIYTVNVIGNNNANNTNKNETPNQVHKNINQNFSTIETEWQWNPKDVLESPSQTPHLQELPFTQESVYIALQAIKIDDQGNIILDHDALLSLDEALERDHYKLNNETLAELQKLIITSLPGMAGKQTAEIVGDYYHFLKARENFIQIYEEPSNSNDEASIASLENDQAIYQELKALRVAHLGEDVAEQLFRITDANAEFMFESMKLAMNNTLTEDQKEQLQSTITNTHIEQSVNVMNWPSRYQAFLKDKQFILDASISDQEKSKQLDNLLSQHFNQEEIQRIEYLGLNQPSI